MSLADIPESFLTGGVIVPIVLADSVLETTEVFRPPFPYTETNEFFLSPEGTGDDPTLRRPLEAWLGRRCPNPSNGPNSSKLEFWEFWPGVPFKLPVIGGRMSPGICGGLEPGLG